MKTLLSACLLFLIATTTQAAEFRGIRARKLSEEMSHPLVKPQLNITSISGDGSTIGGHIREVGVDFGCAVIECGVQAFVWSHANEKAASLPTLRFDSRPIDTVYPVRVPELSFDGSKALVTYARQRYTSAIVEQNTQNAIKILVVSDEEFHATSMSPDATTIVGTRRNSEGDRPFIITPQGERVIDDASAEDFFYPIDMSRDGSVVVANRSFGSRYFISGNNVDDRAVRYTESTGFDELPPIADYQGTRAEAISADGQTIVGTSYRLPVTNLDQTAVATVWHNGQPRLLGGPFYDGRPLDVSASGDVAVGTHTAGNLQTDAFFYPEAVLWRNGTSYRIRTLLEETYGLESELAGWRLTEATAISLDGRVIAGQGIDPDGERGAWVVTLPVPEPSGIFLMSFLIGSTVLQRRNNREICC